MVNLTISAAPPTHLPNDVTNHFIVEAGARGLTQSPSLVTSPKSVFHASSLSLIWFSSYHLFLLELQKVLSWLVWCIAGVATDNFCSFHHEKDSCSPVLDPELALRLDVQLIQHCVSFKREAQGTCSRTTYYHCHVGKARLAC